MCDGLVRCLGFLQLPTAPAYCRYKMPCLLPLQTALPTASATQSDFSVFPDSTSFYIILIAQQIPDVYICISWTFKSLPLSFFLRVPYFM